MQRLRVTDGDGGEVTIHGEEALALWTLADAFAAATVSACDDCGSRVVAAVAVVDLLEHGAAHPATGALIDLADEAPTLHLYVSVAAEPRCQHPRWRDPGFDEWCDAFGVPRRVRKRR